VNRYRYFIVALVFFGGGAAFGWWQRGRVAEPPSPMLVRHATSEAVAKAPVAVARAAAASPSSVADVPSRNARNEETPLSRLRALDWFRTNAGGYFGIGVFVGDSLNPDFIRAYDLSPAEVAALESALRGAKTELTAMAIQGATVQIDTAATKLTATISPTPVKGGEVYDALLTTFRSVLGPDKFNLFNKLSGESFDRGLDAYGAARLSYEVTKRNDPSGGLLYVIKRSSVLPNSNGNSMSMVPPDGVEKFDPVLAKLIPPEFSSPGQK
jgi:hypothetical protein